MGKKGNTQDNINQKITLVVRSGKYRVGYKLAQKALRNGQSKLLIIANNCPAIRKTQLEYMAILANSHVIHFDGNNVELGKSHFRTTLLFVSNALNLIMTLFDQVPPWEDFTESALSAFRIQVTLISSPPLARSDHSLSLRQSDWSERPCNGRCQCDHQ